MSGVLVLDATGNARDDDSGVAEITGLLRHSHGGDRCRLP